MDDIKVGEEVGFRGSILMENLDLLGITAYRMGTGASEPDKPGLLTIRTAEDGRIWVNWNGMSILRFAPAP